jgi:hypothetical protein
MSPDKGRYHDNYDRIDSRHGGFLGGKALFRGVVAAEDLAGKKTQTEALLLGFMGRYPEPAETRLFDALICLNVYPDPRIWTMRVGAYAADGKSPFPSAYSAALSAFNSRIYGTQPIVECGHFIVRSMEALAAGIPLAEVLSAERKRNPVLPGFGRPVAPGPDERFTKSVSLLEECGFKPGPGLTFIRETATHLNDEKGIWPNYAASFSAILLDPPFSFTVSQLYPSAQCIAHLPLLFAIQDVVENRRERNPFLPLKVDDVRYTGSVFRPVPQSGEI